MNGELADIPEELRVLVECALAESRRQLENTGTMEPLFLLWLSGGRGVEFVVCDGPEGNDILNDKRAKRDFYDFLRARAADRGAEAVAIVADAWAGVPTPEGKALGGREFARLAGRHSLKEMEAFGFVRRQQAVTVQVQTPDRAILMQQL